MSEGDWLRIIREIADMRTEMVQFIGGEPTMHPSLPNFVRLSLALNLRVEVFSNLTRVPPDLWNLFAQPGVRLATSYYSDSAAEHEQITRRRGSHGQTRSNIVEALRRSIPLRVGLIDVQSGQRIEQARSELLALGVSDIGYDRLRQVGRGVRDQVAGISQLCGSCARQKIAVASSGDVWPCVFARWLSVGNVRETSLMEILAAPRLGTVRAELRSARAAKRKDKDDKDKCTPDTQCRPAADDCQPDCPPSYHSDTKKCWPYYYAEEK